MSRGDFGQITKMTVPLSHAPLIDDYFVETIDDGGIAAMALDFLLKDFL